MIGLASFPANMHPLITGQSVRGYIQNASRRSVTRFDEAGAVVCQLCTEVPSVANGRAKVVDLPDGRKGMEVTFTLRPGLRWGDGTALTTRDILFGAEVAHSVAPLLNVTGVAAKDESTYTVQLNAVRFDFDRLSPDPIDAAVEQSLFHAASDMEDYSNKSAFNRTPTQPGLWNGPYLLTEFKPNESVTFTPNPYWEGEKPGFKQIIMRLIPSAAALEANLLSGDIDLANGLGFDQVSDLEKHHADKFDVIRYPNPLITTYLYLQTESPLLADKRVRQAIAMGIDKQTITLRLFGGQVPVANSIVATADNNYNKGLKPWPFDPKRARAVLAEAGYTPGPDGIMTRQNGSRLSLDLIAGAGSSSAELLQQVIQSELKQIGIEVLAKTEPFRLLDGTTLQRRLFKGMVIEWSRRPPGNIPVATFGSSGIPTKENGFSGANYTGYDNRHLDDLFRTGLAELDPVRRQAIWNDIQMILMDDLPQIPIYNDASVFISPKWMAGLTPRRSLYDPTLWIEYWKPR